MNLPNASESETPRPPSKGTPRRRSRRNLFAWLVTGLILLFASFWYYASAGNLTVRAEQALGRHDFPAALQLAEDVLREHPQSDRALMVSAAARQAMGDFPSAFARYNRVSPTDKSLLALARREQGRLKFHANRPVEAEAFLQEALLLDPTDAIARDQLIHLLILEGRFDEARKLIFRQLRSGVVKSNYLVIVERHHPKVETAVQYAERCLSVAPQESIPRLALAQKAWLDFEPDVARKHLDQVMKTHPELVEALALRCEIATETESPDEIDRLVRRLPSPPPAHADVWLCLGAWSETAGQTAAAARCCWEAVRLDPNYAKANYRLAQVLTRLGMTEEARTFAQRAQELSALTFKMSSLHAELDLEKMPSIVSHLEKLGRFWEAAAWCRVILQETGQLPAWARQTELRLYPSLSTCGAFTAASHDPSLALDLSGYPLPAFSGAVEEPPPASPSDAGAIAAGFADDAHDVGLDFTYRNGAGADDWESMLEMNGGGVAVLDYDGDCWPDLYFTQGGRLPPEEFDASLSDRLFRNGGGDSLSAARNNYRFEDVTQAAGLRDKGYGQGVTVGDYDSDGFPDLYVGNIGDNQFYRNNGDGTFSDVTSETGTQAGCWTSSCVLADFNSDGLSDLYVVTYLSGKEIFQPCRKRIYPRCAPLSFPAEPDRFYLNLGDGRFQDISELHGLQAPDGRGLGVVAADFDASGRLSLFVANDMSANFFFVNRTVSPNDVRFDEQGLVSGLALDHLGNMKACMGVAAGDMNGDGRIDLFVTNYYRQANDLYVQQPDGTFRDQSREARLFEPGFRLLGWGAQFLDADLDGDPDLFVANGHVHDPIDPQIPYEMPDQFFSNRGDGAFDEIAPQQLGEFFLHKRLGRAVALLDWNRDGREDVCISNLNSPANLLTNETTQAGHFAALRLIGTESQRDAIGAHVQVAANGRKQYKQLTAGDGFQAANERRLVFGLGEADVIDAVEILWPSGRRQSLQSLPRDREWVIVEGTAIHDVSARFSKRK
jgi:tetratricopeptide (TPR) repeat protein